MEGEEMKHRPILFSTAMVQAILDGRKTQTRRVVKPQPYTVRKGKAWQKDYVTVWSDDFFEIVTTDKHPETGQQIVKPIKCPYGQAGDVLWVRETWAHTSQLNINSEDVNYGYVYKADGQPWEDYEGWRWRPSIHMPREAARLFLRITNVRVERLQEISEEDAINEGVERKHGNALEIQWKCYGNDNAAFFSPSYSFRTLWQSINGPESWEANPWVWVVEFERISREEAGL
jgi:DNA-directed RNA polymerase subunit H (RpoH/RPB5)